MKSLILLALTGLFSNVLMAADDSLRNKINISAYVETYYTYDFANPKGHNRPSFIYSHNRHNEISLNLALLRAHWQNENMRFNLAWMEGNYANINLASEPVGLQNVYEANIGFRASKNKKIWIDAGILPSHIGYETAIGKDYWNLTRSLVAESSPYYESGLRGSYESNNEKWYLAGFILNGWQRIQWIDSSNNLCFGHQLTYKPNSKITLNSSSFLGKSAWDSTHRIRYYHNFFALFQCSEKLRLFVDFDFGAQEKNVVRNAYRWWYSGTAIAKYSIHKRADLCARIEYFSDPDNVIVKIPNHVAFETIGYSVNLDYHISDMLCWRFEGRTFQSSNRIFQNDADFVHNNIFVATALAFQIN